MERCRILNTNTQTNAYHISKTNAMMYITYTICANDLLQRTCLTFRCYTMPQVLLNVCCTIYIFSVVSQHSANSRITDDDDNVRPRQRRDSHAHTTGADQRHLHRASPSIVECARTTKTKHAAAPSTLRICCPPVRIVHQTQLRTFASSSSVVVVVDDVVVAARHRHRLAAPYRWRGVGHSRCTQKDGGAIDNINCCHSSRICWLAGCGIR